MKYSELKKLLKKNGCRFLKDGTRHDIWINEKTGRKFTVPRHQSHEVAESTLNSILKSAGLK